ncbi:hypothetical protein ABRY23_05740 [Melioribacteraceae bacterium 4301-Me]|uniref:hypothetical protein n=1 Tax=Pyranulibacter aquaticus TaxID=3163344 RepID=UPI0035990D2B
MLENQKVKKSIPFDSLKRTLPLVTIFILTAALMFYFRYHKKNFNSFIESDKKSLISLYTENLKPLFFKSEITNEDIFNFAVSRQLPLIKENNKEFILANSDSAGYQVYELKHEHQISTVNNYANFKNYFHLNDKESTELDSILNSYKRNIYKYVWLNDKNTVAVNPLLLTLQKEILGSLISFVSKKDKNKILKLSSKEFYDKIQTNIPNLTNFSQSDTSKDFIILAPDTMLIAKVKFNPESFDTIYSRWEVNLQKIKSQLKNFQKGETRLATQLKDIKIDVPDLIIAELFPNKADKSVKSSIDKLRFKIPKTQNQFMQDSLIDSLREIIFLASKLSLNNLQNEPFQVFKGDKIQKRIIPSRVKEVEKVELGNIDKIVNEVVKEFSKGDKADWEKFGQKIDSLTKNISEKEKNSVNKKINK